MPSRTRLLALAALACAALVLLAARARPAPLLARFRATPLAPRPPAPAPAPPLPPPPALPPARAHVIAHELTALPGRAHTHGFSVIDNLYLRGGVLFAVVADPRALPAREALLSVPQEEGVLEPTDKQMRYLTPREARGVLGETATRIDGVTVLVYDPVQFLPHYYHWWGEVILGFWRVYATLGTADAPPPAPHRFLLPFTPGETWRDPAGVDAPLMRAAFPGTAVETARAWDDRAALNTTAVFARAVLVNRVAAHRHPLSWHFCKMIASTLAVRAPADFWRPVRDAVVAHTRPAAASPPSSSSPSPPSSSLPLVTYISRQGGGRRLRAADHAALVAALRALAARGVCAVEVVRMERLALAAQIALVARTTIIVGVHGNGLTHQLWMPPGPRTAVFEMFFPGGYTFDYEILARSMGHKHFGVWNDTLVTYPAGTYHERVEFPEGFGGDAIPVHGATVAEGVRRRLMEPLEG